MDTEGEEVAFIKERPRRTRASQVWRIGPLFELFLDNLVLVWLFFLDFQSFFFGDFQSFCLGDFQSGICRFSVVFFEIFSRFMDIFSRFLEIFHP